MEATRIQLDAADIPTHWYNVAADLPVRIVSDDDIRTGICAGVDDDGALLLRTDTGMQRILAGDVSLRPLTGDAA